MYFVINLGYTWLVQGIQDKDIVLSPMIFFKIHTE